MRSAKHADISKGAAGARARRDSKLGLINNIRWKKGEISWTSRRSLELVLCTRERHRAMQGRHPRTGDAIKDPCSEKFRSPGLAKALKGLHR
jgi:hypothetical protein